MTGKVFLVTGPAGNLGKAVTKKFLSKGASLILVDRHPDRLISLYPELFNDNKHLLIPGIDLTDQNQVDSIVEKSLNLKNRIDGIINTAGGFRMGERTHEISDENWEFLLNLNIKTILNISRAFIPHMLKQKSGKIITIGARPAFSGKSRMGPYSVSKAGVLRLTETMSAEYKSQGINVNCVIPGTIDTPQNRQAMPDADTAKWVKPESLAEVIYFLCSKKARDIHGAAIPVYGA
jgi:NAD(P)-dependent dehydrogenase (short-subunit alcohol dehydrogenase family)